MRILGAALLVAACTWLGIARAGELRFHRRCVDDVLSALRYLEAEVRAAGTPLPEIYAALAERRNFAPRCVFEMLARGAKADGDGCMGALWSACWLRETHVALTQNERRSLARLGPVLGRYPAREQSLALLACIAQFERASAYWETRARDGAKLSASVGLTMGLMLAAALV
ncbi:MAG: stage III sporulation protein AB [Oscillospiraceae bacterium]|jgi:stage III sporulation protein AB